MNTPEHKIRTAIKAYLDAGGDPEFYILSKNHFHKNLTPPNSAFLVMKSEDKTYTKRVIFETEDGPNKKKHKIKVLCRSAMLTLDRILGGED